MDTVVVEFRRQIEFWVIVRFQGGLVVLGCFVEQTGVIRVHTFHILFGGLA